MSEVKDVHGSTGDVSERPGSGAGPDETQLSGYLCGVCEEPLPYGATACPACETPVAPLDEDELVAGPYVHDDDDGPAGEDPGRDTAGPDGRGPAEAPPAPAGLAGDPYGQPSPAGAGPTEPGRGGAPPVEGAGYGTEPPMPILPPQPRRADRPIAGHDPQAPPAPPASADTRYDVYAPAALGNGSPVNGTATAPEPPAVDERPPSPTAADPAEVIGVERPAFPPPPTPEVGTDPMLGRGPTEPVLPAPPRRDHGSAVAADADPLGPLAGGRSRADTDRQSGSMVPILAGGVLAILALVVGSAVLLTRAGGDVGVTATPTTEARDAAPEPTAAVDRPTGASPSTTGPVDDEVEPEVEAVRAVPPTTATFCIAAGQFKIDGDPNSIARKFLANPTQLLVTTEALVHNAPDDAQSAVTPVRDTIRSLATRVRYGEISTPSELAAATDPATGEAAWTRFDRVILPAAARHCPSL